MTLASFFLVVHEREREDARRAGLLYLVASQVGTAALLAMFLLLGDAGGGPPAGAAWLDFSRFGPAPSPGIAAAVFLLAILGFGTKAGLVPLHVWLPEAHPAAPSHVSALMSGAMINLGVYGLIRVIATLRDAPPWWGWTLLGVGALTATLGVLFSLAQQDLKRMLAYSSVENMGIVAVGMRMGILGTAAGQPVVAVLGWGGALLHVITHSAVKGLLFLGAGSVAHAAGTREMDRLGGLSRRMPVTGATFLVATASICALPPFGGFVGELLVLTGALAMSSALVAAIVIVTLGMVGGLAVAAFFVPGCPPHPLTILDGLLRLLGRRGG